jgi:nickel/cobalt exporter
MFVTTGARGAVLRAGLGLGFVLALGLAVVWATGGLGWLETAVRAAQKAAQSSLAGALRALKGGQPGAWAGLMAVCFTYGFLHAAGPGHGKLVIGGYGMAARIKVWPLIALALVSSLAQALVAVLLVLGGVLVLGWGRERLQGVSDTVLAPLGTWLIIGLGLWIMGRGVLRAWRVATARDVAARGHDHGHVHDEHCGHAHGPTVEQVSALRTWRQGAMLVGAIAIRPCTGALFVLIVTQSMGIGLAGVAGALAMGLGTATVTALVAVMAVWAREGALVNLPGAGLARALPVVEVVAGALIVLAAAMLLGRSG